MILFCFIMVRSVTISSWVTQRPVSGFQSWRFTPLSLIALPFTKNNPSFISMVRNPTFWLYTSRTFPVPSLKIICRSYSFGCSADHGVIPANSVCIFLTTPLFGCTCVSTESSHIRCPWSNSFASRTTVLSSS